MNILTSPYKASPLIRDQAKVWASKLDLTFVDRKKESLKKLQEMYGADYILVYGSDRIYAYFGPHQEHDFHLSMAQLRIIQIDRGKGAHLLEAVGLDCESILDCTLGLGADAIILSYALGPKASIEGVEGALPLWFITSQGLTSFLHKSPKVTQALRRIQTHYGQAESFLAACPDKSKDVVYFDPMFQNPVEESPQFKPLRGHLVDRPLTSDLLAEAKRVAKKRVVVKERKGARLFKELPPDYFVGGKYSKQAYGIYEVDS